VDSVGVERFAVRFDDGILDVQRTIQGLQSLGGGRGRQGQLTGDAPSGTQAW
jgi:hypothetical protein